MNILAKYLVIISLALLSSSLVFADTLKLKSGHPDTYVVKKGDTLWDISATFLNSPWLWPKLWGQNKYIANPDLIYPGDRLTLVFVDGQPRLVLKPHISKSPTGRIISKGDAIPAINFALIKPYLGQDQVVDSKWLMKQPVVLGGERDSGRFVEGDIIYVQGQLNVGENFGVYYIGRNFVATHPKRQLGQEVILSATGRVVESGDVSKILLDSNKQETRAGYRVFPLAKLPTMPDHFAPSAATVSAKVLAAGDGAIEMGKLDVLYLDKGAEDGVKVGQVFSIFDNKNKKGGEHHNIKLPDRYMGKLMVFKVFGKVSQGIILKDGKYVRIDDKLLPPHNLTMINEQ